MSAPNSHTAQPGETHPGTDGPTLRPDQCMPPISNATYTPLLPSANARPPMFISPLQPPFTPAQLLALGANPLRASWIYVPGSFPKRPSSHKAQPGETSRPHDPARMSKAVVNSKRLPESSPGSIDECADVTKISAAQFLKPPTLPNVSPSQPAVPLQQHPGTDAPTFVLDRAEPFTSNATPPPSTSDRQPTVNSPLQPALEQFLTVSERLSVADWWTTEPLQSPKKRIFSYLFDAKETGGQAGGPVSVSGEDLARLAPRQLFSDSLVMFGFLLALKRLQENNSTAFASVYVYSNFFYTRLKKDGYAKIAKWTKSVDIFRKRCLMIPVNQSSHWFLVLILHPGLCLDGENQPFADQQFAKSHPAQTRMIALDSLGFYHSEVFTVLKDYLLQEAKARHPCPAFRSPLSYELKVPQQTNTYDCGLFVIHFAEMYLSDLEFYGRVLALHPVPEQSLQELWQVHRITGLRQRLTQAAQQAMVDFQLRHTGDSSDDDEQIEVLSDSGN
ncbi:cysteine proteinase [Hymenopellis radicata]|nr:cysteine proteinase [Hymenopellis radicata]